MKLAAASVLPLLLLVFAGASQLIERERAAFERGVQGEARALTSAVDARVDNVVATLATLAATPAFDAADLDPAGADAFREQARRVLAERAAWRAIELYSPAGERLAALTRGPAMLPPLDERPLVQHAAATLRAGIGDLAPDVAPGEIVFPVAMPVVREGRTRFVVTALVTPALLEPLLRTQDFPGDWDVAVLDGAARPIARLPGAAPPGAGVHAVRKRSSASGWTVVFTVPAAMLQDAASRIAWLVLGGGAMLALAMALVWLLTRPAPPAPAAQSAANDEAPEVSRAALRPAAVERRRRSVLVAAADPAVRSALLLAFASEDNRVYAASDGAEALALAHDVRPDIGLVDIRLARIPGYEVAKQLRHQYGRTVWLVAIGERDPEDRARALAAGFDEHLAKPLVPQALGALVASYAPNRVRGLNRDASRSSS